MKTNKNENDKDVEYIYGVPMRWNRKDPLKNLWNKEDDRIFPPKQFGIGWGLNLHALLKRLGVVDKK